MASNNNHDVNPDTTHIRDPGGLPHVFGSTHHRSLPDDPDWSDRTDAIGRKQRSAAPSPASIDLTFPTQETNADLRANQALSRQHFDHSAAGRGQQHRSTHVLTTEAELGSNDERSHAIPTTSRPGQARSDHEHPTASSLSTISGFSPISAPPHPLPPNHTLDPAHSPVAHSGHDGRHRMERKAAAMTFNETITELRTEMIERFEKAASDYRRVDPGVTMESLRGAVTCEGMFAGWGGFEEERRMAKGKTPRLRREDAVVGQQLPAEPRRDNAIVGHGLQPRVDVPREVAVLAGMWAEEIIGEALGETERAGTGRSPIAVMAKEQEGGGKEGGGREAFTSEKAIVAKDLDSYHD